MEIVLLERVEKLGQMGDVVKVKDGYARNYLLPQNKALRATKENLSRFEVGRVELEAHNLERRQEAEAVSEKMQGARVVLVRQASDMGQLYGSVSARDVAEALVEKGYRTERQQVVMDRPIKTLGIHAVRVVLHPEVSITVEANVARSKAEAEQQDAGELGAAEQDAEGFFESPEMASSALESDEEAIGEDTDSAGPEGTAEEANTSDESETRSPSET